MEDPSIYLSLFTSLLGPMGVTMSIGLPLKVMDFYKLVELSDNPAAIYQDAWGVKRLFSHALRRWLSGASSPRDPWFPLINFWCSPRVATLDKLRQPNR